MARVLRLLRPDVPPAAAFLPCVRPLAFRPGHGSPRDGAPPAAAHAPHPRALHDPADPLQYRESPQAAGVVSDPVHGSGDGGDRAVVARCSDHPALMARHGALPALGPVLVTGAGGFIGGGVRGALVLVGVRGRALGPVLVTGAGGFIGGRLCERLVLEGVRVRALVRSTDQAARLAARGVEPVRGDLTRPDDLPPAVRGCGVIFHCGAWMGEPWTWEAARAANVEGTRSLLDASLRAGASRFVHVSSISVYGPTTADPIDEQTPLWPLGPYRATKIGAEQEVVSAHGRGLPTVILRPGQVFGPGDLRLSGLVLRWLRRGLPLVVEGGRGFCYPIYIDNLVDALLASATTADAVGGIFNLADADVPWGEFLGSYARMAGRRMRRFFCQWSATCRGRSCRRISWRAVVGWTSGSSGRTRAPRRRSGILVSGQPCLCTSWTRPKHCCRSSRGICCAFRGGRWS